MERVKEGASKYEVTVRTSSNGYPEARVTTNFVPFNNGTSVTYNGTSILQMISSNDNAVIKSEEKDMQKVCIAEQFFKDWLKNRFSLCIETKDNPNTLCRSTIQENERHIRDIILPYIKKHKKLYLQDLTEEFLDDLLKSVNGNNVKRKVHITLDLIFQYAMKKKIVKENPMQFIDSPPKVDLLELV